MKRGFTLAEVLITLSIIGIISALTLPGLKSSMGTRKADAWYAKYCNILDGAVKQAMFANDIANAENVTYTQLGEQLQAVLSGGEYKMKDGTKIVSLEDNTILVAFPNNINNRRYAINNDFEGIDCTTNGTAE